MTDNEKKPGPLARIRSLDRDTKALWSLGGAALFVALMAKGCGVVVSAKDLEAATAQHRQALSDHAEKEAAERQALDEENELLFQTTVRLTTDSEWLKQEVKGVREDLRRMDRGQPLPALLPSPTPRPPPAPVHTSANPTPTRAP